MEIKPGLFITTIPRETYVRNLFILTGEDKLEYMEKVNSFNEITQEGCEAIFGMTRQMLTLHIWAVNKDFNPRTDFLYMRYDPKPTLFKKPATRSV